MDIFNSISLVVLVLAIVWVYSYASEAMDKADTLRYKIEGLQQRYNGIEYKLAMLEQRLSKKEKKK